MPSLNNLTVQDLQWGTANWSGQGYIDGLKMVWNSANSFSVTSGSAYVPSLNRVLPSPALLTLAGLALTASTWYHVYLYGNPGSPAIECVTTAPAAAYYGTARAKTGDTSRRYIGSVLTDASGNIFSFAHSGNSIKYVTNVNAAPFLVLSAGRATSATNIACSGVAPVTAAFTTLLALNADSANSVSLGNSSMSTSLSAGSYIAFVFQNSTEMLDMPLDSSLQFDYMYSASPSGALYVRVVGYVFER